MRRFLRSVLFEGLGPACAGPNQLSDRGVGVAEKIASGKMTSGQVEADLVSVGEGVHRVELRVARTQGAGLCVFLTGGQLAHVGGVALAIPRLSLTGQGMSCDVSQLCAPGHKDVELAAYAARRISVATGQVVSATAGMHVDDATSQDIGALACHVGEAIDRWLDQRGLACPCQDEVGASRLGRRAQKAGGLKDKIPAALRQDDAEGRVA